jgi:hypothetical protein
VVLEAAERWKLAKFWVRQLLWEEMDGEAYLGGGRG